MNCLITGATSGIGLETAKGLAAKGYEVFFVARDKNRAETALAEIQQAGGNRNGGYFLCDLSSQKQIRKMAEEVIAKLDHLDVLVNNAGQVYSELNWSEDHIEMQFAANHLAPFLLTGLLLPLLKKAPAARVVSVSSDMHYYGKVHWDDVNLEKKYSWMDAYGQAKLCNVLFIRQLAEKFKGTQISTYAVHPGLVKTKIGNKHTGWFEAVSWSFITTFGISAVKGAATSIYVASSPEVQGQSGLYWARCKFKYPSRIAQDPANMQRLWELSEKMTGISY